MENPFQNNQQSISQIKQMYALAEQTFWGYLRCEIKKIKRGKVTLVLTLQPHHLNLQGIVHGGVISSLLDNTMGIAVITERFHEQIVTTNSNVHFVSSLQGGVLYSTAKVLHQSRKIITVSGEVRREDGQLSAIGSGSFKDLQSDLQDTVQPFDLLLCWLGFSV